VGGKLAVRERSLSVPPAMTAPYGQVPHPTEINPPVFCPKCFSTNLKVESGCLACLDCGNSKCG